MELPPLYIINEYAEIPESFYSDDTKEPIKNCVVCDKFLLNEGTPYLIEKAFKRYKAQQKPFVVFEYAICFDCHEKMKNALSKESLQRIDEYFENRTNLYQRRKSLLREESTRAEDWFSNCVITGESIDQVEEFQICGQFDGQHMLYAYMPFMISNTAMDEISELLSTKSLGELDDFMGEHFGLPPEIKEALKNRDKVIF